MLRLDWVAAGAFGQEFIGVRSRLNVGIRWTVHRQRHDGNRAPVAGLHHCIMEGLFYNVKYGYLQRAQLFQDLF